MQIQTRQKRKGNRKWKQNEPQNVEKKKLTERANALNPFPVFYRYDGKEEKKKKMPEELITFKNSEKKGKKRNLGQ